LNGNLRHGKRQTRRIVFWEATEARAPGRGGLEGIVSKRKDSRYVPADHCAGSRCKILLHLPHSAKPKKIGADGRRKGGPPQRR